MPLKQEKNIEKPGDDSEAQAAARRTAGEPAGEAGISLPIDAHAEHAPLVNENVDKVLPLSERLELLEQKYRRVCSKADSLERERDRLIERALTAERKNVGVGRESRTMRLYVEIVQGLVGRGLFDPDNLKKLPSDQFVYIENLFKHAAGLAEVAQKSAEGRF